MTEIEQAYTCRACGVEFHSSPCIHPITGVEIFVPKYCDACAEAIERDEAKRAGDLRTVRLLDSWREYCPPLYRDTDISRIPAALRVPALAWADSSPPEGQGLGIVGATGMCKTRMLYELLKRQHHAGRRVAAFSGVRLARAITDSFDDDPRIRNEARAVIKEAHSVRWLLLDDVGKERFTDRMASELWALIEHRTSHKLPLLWSANATGAELVARMGAEHGAAVVRRMVEFSKVIAL